MTLVDQSVDFVGFNVKYVKSDWLYFAIMLVYALNGVGSRFTGTKNQNVLKKLIF